LNAGSESLPMTDAGSEFHTDGAAHRKERFAKSVRANGWRDFRWSRSLGKAARRKAHLMRTWI